MFRGAGFFFQAGVWQIDNSEEEEGRSRWEEGACQRRGVWTRGSSEGNLSLVFTMSHRLVPGTICLRTRVHITTKTNRLQPLILGNMTWEHTDNIIFLPFSCGVQDRWGETWAEAVLSMTCLHLVDCSKRESAFHQHFLPSTSLFSCLHNFTKHTKPFNSCHLNMINTQYIQRTAKQQLLSLIWFLVSQLYTHRPSFITAAKVIFFHDRKQDYEQRIVADAISCYLEMEMIAVGYYSVILMCLHSNLSSHFSLTDISDW